MSRPKEFSEDEALAKAAQLFWRNGYHNTSMQELVAETGVCRASLYETYGDKHALYLKALTHHRAETISLLTSRMAVADSAEGKIRAFFEFVVNQLIEELPSRGCFVTNSTLEMLPEYRQTVGLVIGDNFDSLNNLFVNLLQQGIATGEFRADLPIIDTAQFLLSLIGGLNVVGKVRPDQTVLNSIVNVSMQVLH